MYSFSITEQLVIFIESIGFGVLIAISYGIVNIIVSLFLSGRRKTVVSDILFSLICAFAVFSFILAFNLGKLRFYMVIGTVTGLVAYTAAFGSYAKQICEGATGCVHKLFSAMFKPVKNLIKRKPKKEKKPKKMRKALAKEKESVV